MKKEPRLIPPLTEAQKESFWSKVRISENPNDCWEWTGSKERYGLFGIHPHGNFKAHRIAQFLTNGQIPDGLHVCHKCDNPGCCNPGHFFLGTHAENMRDMFKKNRRIAATGPKQAFIDHPEKKPSGEKNPACKITESVVREIRSEYDKGGIGTRPLSKKFGVSRSQIKRIVARQSWKHIKN